MMTFRSLAAVAALPVALSGLVNSDARAAEVIVLSTVAAKSALVAIASAFERDSGHRLILHFATTGELRTELEKGANCDVALLTVAALDDLIKQGRFIQASRVGVARSGIGIA